MEGLIFGGSYLRREICVSKSIGLALFTVFALFFFVFEGNFPSTSPRGAYIWRGDLTRADKGWAVERARPNKKVKIVNCNLFTHGSLKSS